MDKMQTVELLLRGATLGVLVLVMLVIVKSAGVLRLRVLAVLFAIGSAAYTVDTSLLLIESFPWICDSVLLLAMLNCVFFWWFGRALLDDEFEWQAVMLVPFVVVLGLFVFGLLEVVPNASHYAEVAVQLITITLMVHVAWIAISLRGDDLLEKRRRFRVIFTVVIAATCITVAAIRLALGSDKPPAWMTLLHASELFVITAGFCAWILKPGNVFVDIARSPLQSPIRTVSATDRLELERLETLMTGGFYKKDGLTIRELADSLEIPEHRLRQLINQRLGYRNFTAYLNSHRLNEARQILGDPEHSRLQITQIAFDLGYGSIAPFNRAFKAQEGMTPTEFRRAALANPAVVGRNH